ncbi:MAG: HAD hydrolase-like protein [Clostridia bacterium]|nr:HAD hydrolase-like protein [Clostridia bacterium]
MYKTALFDLDGTLTDSSEGIANAIVYALGKFGIEVEDRASLRVFMGPPLAESFNKYYGLCGEDVDRVIRYYREYYSEKGIWENKPYPEMHDVLKTLREGGVRTGLSTAKPLPFAEKIIKKFGFYDYFDDVRGATFDGSVITKEQVVALSVQKFGKIGTVMVGDRDNDVYGAKANGIDCIGVLYGFGTREELEAAGVKHIAETPEDIIRIVLKGR